MWEPTHLSVFDGSDAQLFAIYSPGFYVMENECGETWTDPKSVWIPIGEEV